MFKGDGAYGTVLQEKDFQCLVAWEDRVLSWESVHSLQRIETPSALQA
jgi:hypothetical protein